MTSQTLNHLTNPSNPYYLSINENPAMVIVPSLLTENNYHDTDNNDMNKVLMNIVIDPRNNERYGRGRGSNYNGRGGKENNFCFCTYCGRNNHIVDTCYHKYGFP